MPKILHVHNLLVKPVGSYQFFKWLGADQARYISFLAALKILVLTISQSGVVVMIYLVSLFNAVLM